MADDWRLRRQRLPQRLWSHRQVGRAPSGRADYNTERSHLGYRNYGRRPMDTITAYLAA